MRGLHILIGVVAGVLTYLILAVLINLVVGGLAGGFLMLAGLVVATVVGVWVYRLIRRRVVPATDEQERGGVDNRMEATE